MKRILIPVMICLFLTGCFRPFQKPKPVNEPPVGNNVTEKIIEKVVHRTDYLFSVLIVSAVLGFVVAFNGMKKLGTSVMLGSGLGMFLKMMISIVWMYYLAGILVFLAIVFGVVSMYTHRKDFLGKDIALNDLVGLIDKYKTHLDATNQTYTRTMLKKILGEEKDTTQAIVAKIRQTDLQTIQEEKEPGQNKS